MTRVLLVLIALTAVPATAADFTAFRSSCAKAGGFLIGDMEGREVTPVLDILCPCLAAGFASYSQPEINALEADLRTGTSDEAKATFPRYQELQAKASGVLKVCLASPQVMAAERAAGLETADSP